MRRHGGSSGGCRRCTASGSGTRSRTPTRSRSGSAAAPSFDPDKLTVEELEQLLALTEKASGDDGSD